LASASVLHSECVYADAYATAFMVMGPEKALSVAEERGLAAVFLIHDGSDGFETTMTSAFDSYMKSFGDAAGLE